MSYAVKILTPADDDAVDAALWYDAQVPGLGAEFLKEMDNVVQRIALNPEIYGIRFSDVRRVSVQRFRFYGLYYFIRDAEVWVIAVHHGRRHPRWLRMRRKQVG